MDKNKKINIAIIGAGRLGTTISYIIASKNKKNIRIISIASPTQKTLDRAKKTLGGFSKKIIFTKNNKKAATEANCIFICTPDDIIKKVCRELFGQKKQTEIKQKKENIFVAHFSGSKPLKDLNAARAAGAASIP